MLMLAPQPSQNIAARLPQSQNTTYVQQSQNISANLQQSQNITPNASIQPPQNIAQQPQNGSASKQQSQNVSISAHQAQNVTTTNVQHVQNIPANLQQSQNITTNIHQSQNVAVSLQQMGEVMVNQSIPKQQIPLVSMAQASHVGTQASSAVNIPEISSTSSIKNPETVVPSQVIQNHVETKELRTPPSTNLQVSQEVLSEIPSTKSEVNGEETSE
ncbi:hypothetical protein CEXT_481171, partial [Caerostris extrusa]